MFTVAPIVFGLDKFANVLTDWPQYLAPWIDRIVPGTAQQAMYAVGVVEVLAGVLVAVAPRIGAWVVAAWLAGIIVEPADHPRLLRRRTARLRAARRRRRPGPARRAVRARAAASAATRDRRRTGARRAPGARPRLRVVRSRADVDLPAAERAVADLLRALGKDPADAAPGRHPAPGGRRLRRAAHPARRST